MMTIIWTWAASATAQTPPETVVELAPSPVQEWAKRDLRADRWAQVGFVASAAGPGLLLIGGALLAQDPDAADPNQQALNASFAAFGFVASLAGPAILLTSSWRSSSALRRQGLDVRPSLAIAGAGLAATGVIYTAARIQSLQEVDVSVVAGLYLGAVALGAAQIRRNHLARRDAGWLGVVPTLDQGAGGIALVRTF